ncbi:MAG: hypothetical protein ACHQFW_07665 [Chitinophagales bacterium]
MKKLIPVIFFAICAVNSNTLMATSPVEPASTPKPTTEVKLSESDVARLAARYEEINKMDKSNLSGTEKRELRNESSQIKKELKAQDGTVIYISSAAAIILIVILLILLL